MKKNVGDTFRINEIGYRVVGIYETGLSFEDNGAVIGLADEPTGNLDSQNTADIMALLVDLNAAQGTTMLIVTHNHEVAQKARRVITFRDGKIQQDVVLHNIFESQLIDFKSSALGQAIICNEELPEELREIAPRLRELLERV